jgi:DNA polymerase-3 subunit alpha
MAFGSLEDMHGTVDLVVFPDAFEKLRERFVVDALVVLQGKFSGRNGRTSVQVEEVLPIDKARESLADTVNVLLPADAIRMERMEALRNLCMRHPGGCQLRLHLDLGGDQPTIVVSRRVEVAPSDALMNDIANLAGQIKAWVSKEAGRARRAARRVVSEAPEPAPDIDFVSEDLVPA